MSSSFWEISLHRSDLVLVKIVAPVLQEVVIFEVLLKSHVDASSRMDFEGEYFEVMETDAEEATSAARLFAERNDVEVFLLWGHMYRPYLCLRDFVIVCGSLLESDFEVVLPSDL